MRILSISGLRGTIGDGLDPEYITRFAAALGTVWGGGTVVLARDGRETGPMVKHAVLAGLLATGCRVLDAGIAATPTCGVLVTHHKAAGGLQITASHNPPEYNGLKPFGPSGGVFDAEQGKEFLSVFEAGKFSYRSFDQLGVVEALEDPGEPHLDRVLQCIESEADAIRSRKFKVVLDCNHGSGSCLGPRLLSELGCDVTVVGEEPDGKFTHAPEPLAENLTSLCDAVREAGADVGFAQDPDADRLAIVDNNGCYIGEELTLALCADFVLARRPGPLVVNGSTSRVNSDIAAAHGCEFHRSHVGEANVCAEMRRVNAVLGGEGNGGVIEPRVGFVRDSFVSMAYVLAGLAKRAESLSDWAGTLPRYAIVKDKVVCPREHVEPACEALAGEFSDAKATRGDGLRLDWNDRWVQLRASNTEPIIRAIAEAPDERTARELVASALQVVQRSQENATCSRD